MITKRYIFIILIFPIYLINAQSITVDDNFTATQLVEQFLINNPCANVSNVQVSGFTFGNGDKSFGYFNHNGSNFPFQEGVIITNGRAKAAIGPNSSLLSEGPNSWLGDADLQQAIGENNTFNATILTFDFLPLTNKISFDYIFSSEQYLAYSNANQCQYSDGFAFLLKEAGSSQPYQNLAVVPGTNTLVKVTTVRGTGTICQPMNQQFFDAFNGSDHPTNYNGQTKILRAEATVTPNILYQIKLVIADQGNPLYDSAIFLGGGSFQGGIDLGSDLLIANQTALCAGTIHLLNATIPNAQAYQWFKNGLPISNPNPNPAIFEVIDAGLYKVEVNINGSSCVLSGQKTVEYYPAPNLSTILATNCGANNSSVFNLIEVFGPTFAIFNQSQSTIHLTMQEALDHVNSIINVSNFSTLNNTSVYLRIIDSTSSCVYYQQANLQVSNLSGASIPFFTCDLDSTANGMTAIDLNTTITPLILQNFTSSHQVGYYMSLNDAVSKTNVLPNIFTNTTPFSQTIFGRVSLNNTCEDVITVNLIIEAVVIDEPITTLTICPNRPLTLNAPILNSASYLWQNGQTSSSIVVNQPGTYSVAITTANGCASNKTFIVTAIEPFTLVNIEQSNFQHNNYIQVFTAGNLNLEYSIDGSNFQDSPFFNNLTAGFYTVSIRDKFLCNIINKRVIILDYPRFFTPNGDGFNDFWGIKYLPPQAEINIFDRLGKFIATLKNNQSWDGTYNKENLPSTDYWFTLTIAGEVIIKKHFSLKR